MEFKSNLHQACKTGKTFSPFSFIHFRGDFIYISNGTVHIKQLMSLHELSTRERGQLDGHKLHKDAFSFLKKQKDVKLDQFVNQDPEAVFSVAGSECRLRLKKTTKEETLILNSLDELFANFDMDNCKEIAFDPTTIEVIRKAFVTKSSGFTFRFNDEKRGILVTPNQDNYLEHAIICPLKLTGAKNEKL